MTFGMFAVSIAAGVLTGWLAGALVRGHGYGRVPDLLLGLMGSGVLTTVVAALRVPADMGMVAMAGIAALGASIVIVSQRTIWPAPTRP